MLNNELNLSNLWSKNMASGLYFKPVLPFKKPQVTAPNMLVFLDKELTAAIKTPIISFPNPYEDFDVNYIYHYFSPEINTSRRTDHLVKYKAD
jgi:hypothetical protein